MAKLILASARGSQTHGPEEIDTASAPYFISLGAIMEPLAGQTMFPGEQPGQRLPITPKQTKEDAAGSSVREEST